MCVVPGVLKVVVVLDHLRGGVEELCRAACTRPARQIPGSTPLPSSVPWRKDNLRGSSCRRAWTIWS
eukprot:11493212-Prorocentrum_lima.AAC.1